jgi:hypothetical protein
MAMERRYRVESAEFRVSLEPEGEGHLVEVNGRAYAVRVMRFAEGVLDLMVGDRRRRFHVASDPQRLFVFSEGRSYRLERVDPIRRWKRKCRRWCARSPSKRGIAWSGERRWWSWRR